MDDLEEQKSIKLRQRLWGAAVLIALAVIFLPLLLDGAGSESQYRRVERLREEPPKVVRDNNPNESTPIVQESAETKAITDATPAVEKTIIEQIPVSEAAKVSAAPVAAVAPVSGATKSDAQANEASKPSGSTLSAWVVQAGSFGDQQNAIAVRDRLRRAGHPSFISASQDQTLFRVRVGPMTNKVQAASSRDEVMRLLGREALVTPYP